MSEHFSAIYENIPSSLSSTLELLSDQLNLALCLFIKEKDRTFEEIKKETPWNDDILFQRIHKLEIQGLIQNYLQKKPNVPDFSFYTLTPWGHRFIDDIIFSYNDFHQLKKSKIINFKKECLEREINDELQRYPFKKKD
jgi:DNA-binding HxlR family transcriptional regulator